MVPLQIHIKSFISFILTLIYKYQSQITMVLYLNLSDLFDIHLIFCAWFIVVPQLIMPVHEIYLYIGYQSCFLVRGVLMEIDHKSLFPPITEIIF